MLLMLVAIACTSCVASEASFHRETAESVVLVELLLNLQHAPQAHLITTLYLTLSGSVCYSLVRRMLPGAAGIFLR
jgi:hypothetical protein